MSAELDVIKNQTLTISERQYCFNTVYKDIVVRHVTRGGGGRKVSPALFRKLEKVP